MRLRRWISQFAFGIHCLVVIKSALLVILILSTRHSHSITSSWLRQENSLSLHPPYSKETTFEPRQQHQTENLVKSLRAKLHETLRSQLAGFESCVLLDIPRYENKGDLAISLGELSALHAVNLTIRNIYGQLYKERDHLSYKDITPELNPKQTVILAHGGGNIGAWSAADIRLRAPAMEIFKNFKYVILAQSVYFFDKGHQVRTRDQYAAHGDVTILLRDQHSYNETQQNLAPAKPILSPDMAFGIGPVFKYFPPLLDVIWINRGDKERSVICNPKFPNDISYFVTDWLKVASPGSESVVDKTYMKTHNGFTFLQRAKVLVTDRLHGYILATLLDIPAVIIDNKLKKLTNFRNTWTAGKDHTVVAKDCQDAVGKAMDFLMTGNTKRAPGF